MKYYVYLFFLSISICLGSETIERTLREQLITQICYQKPQEFTVESLKSTIDELLGHSIELSNLGARNHTTTDVFQYNFAKCQKTCDDYQEIEDSKIYKCFLEACKNISEMPDALLYKNLLSRVLYTVNSGVSKHLFCESELRRYRLNSQRLSRDSLETQEEQEDTVSQEEVNDFLSESSDIGTYSSQDLREILKIPTIILSNTGLNEEDCFYYKKDLKTPGGFVNVQVKLKKIKINDLDDLKSALTLINKKKNIKTLFLEDCSSRKFNELKDVILKIAEKSKEDEEENFDFKIAINLTSTSQTAPNKHLSTVKGIKKSFAENHYDLVFTNDSSKNT